MFSVIILLIQLFKYQSINYYNNNNTDDANYNTLITSSEINVINADI